MYILHYYDIEDPEVFARVFKGYEDNKTLSKEDKFVIPNKYSYKIGDQFKEFSEKDQIEI